ncbi:DUF3987 domain-containing protein [Nocardia nova]|uniref:DUF3987 domain-containing protein n=1 Tax=Nocardia nova TaxID=37330 RepID=UPI00273928BF|nr:DUF3987 domain-containing protein [Nocardia nova]
MNSEPDSTGRSPVVHQLHAVAAINAAREAEGLPALDEDPAVSADLLGEKAMAVLASEFGAEPEYFGELDWFPVEALAEAAPDFHPTYEEEAKWRADQGVLTDPHAAREAAVQRHADIAVKGAAKAVGMHLPPEFWERRGFLRHIRDAAWERAESPHGALLAVLANLSAYVDPSVRVETGIKSPLPLNMFVGLVSTSGGNKSSAYAFAKRLLRVTLPDPAEVGAIAASEVPLFLGMGSGPGVAQAYMGIPAGAKRGTPQVQVRHKLFLHRDEGGEMLAAMQYSSSSLAPTLRSAWSGELEGQANAGKEAFRNVHDCVLGVAVGFQREVLAKLLTDTEVENGTPQRFLFGSVLDPHAPDIDALPANPGPLEVGPLPVGEMRLCSELQRAVRVADLARRRGEEACGRFESQRPAMVARTAALLAILDTCTPNPGRQWDGTVTADDWALAEVLFSASLAVQEDAAEWAAEMEADKAERRAAAAQASAVANASAVAQAEATLARLGERILGYLPKAGVPVLWVNKGGKTGLLRSKFKGDQRTLAKQALENLELAGKVTFDGVQVTRL